MAGTGKRPYRQSNMLTLADTWGMHGDIGTGWWILMVLGMVIFWGAIILAVVWLVRGGLRPDGGARPETPLDILDRRLADGSISPEEYGERRKLLTGAPSRHGSTPSDRSAASASSG